MRERRTRWGRERTSAFGIHALTYTTSLKSEIIRRTRRRETDNNRENQMKEKITARNVI